MKDEIIEERGKKNKSNVSDSFSFIESREKFRVSLRKKKISEMLSIKRNMKNNKKCEFEPLINLNKVNIELKNDNLTPISQIQFLLNNINDYRKIDDNIFYILYKINENITLLKNNPNEIMEIELTEKLIYFISELNYIDKNLIYLVFKIFLNISTIPNKDLMESFITINFLQITNDILIELYKSPNDYYEIIEVILLFLGNFLEDNPFIQINLYKYRIFNVIYEYLEKNKNVNSLPYYNILYKSIGFFVCFASVKPPQNQYDLENYCKIIDIECIQKLYLLFSHFLFHNTNNKDLILDCIWGLSFLPYFNYEILISNYFKDGIFNKIYELSLSNNIYIVPTIRILGNVTSLNDNFCVNLCDDNLVNFICHNLQNECTPSQVKIEILWVLSNLCLGTNMKCLINYNLLKVLLNTINNDKNKRVVTESLKVLLICLNNSVSIDILCDSIVDIVGVFIHQYEDLEIIMVLAIICEIIFAHPNQNFAYKLINYGIREVLEKWALNNDKELRESAIKMINNKYFC